MQTGSYINGKWFNPSSSQISRNINPADTSDVIAEFPLATAVDVRSAVDAAMAAFPLWKKTPGPERGRVLWRAADIARRRVDEIAQTLTREEGKILREARGEVLKGIAVLDTTPAKASACTARPCPRNPATPLPTRCGSRSAPSD